METNIDHSNYEVLRKEYMRLSEKLDEQCKISDKLLEESMKSKLNSTEQWYRRRLMIPVIILVLAVSFIILGLNKWYIALVVLTGVFEFIADRICFRKLGLGDLMEQDMKTASERLIAHKKARRVADVLEIVPAIPMLAWTIYIAAGDKWDYHAIILFAVFVVFAFIRGSKAARQRGRDLEDFVNNLGC